MPCQEWQVTNKDTMSGSCGPEWLNEQLNDGSRLLFLDCRTQSDYNASHITGAIHVAIPSLMLKRLKKGHISVASVISGNESRDMFQRHCKTDSIIIYDQCTQDIADDSGGIMTLLIRKLTEDGCRVSLLQGGFGLFQSLYSEQCVGSQAESISDEQTILGLGSLRISCEADSGVEEVTTPNSSATFPVEVLPYLFLGNAKNSGDLECLYKNGIKYILNVTPNVANTFEDNPEFKYMQIPISDHWSQNLSIFFQDAIGFIDEARLQKRGVLVHCLAGVSRSVTLTVAYLMSSMSLSLNDAYDYVKRCKPNISPNFNFMGQLLDFEKTLNQGSGVCTCGCSSGGSSASSSAGSSASSTEGELKCQCTQSFFTSPASSPPTLKLDSDLSTSPS